MGDVDKNHFGQ